jgi:2-C-methyl-D-erythritol 2,4-cyclodiphosphate synthase
VSTKVRAEGWDPVNVDCALVLDTPKVAPHRDEMQHRLSVAVGAPVAVKANRAEGLGSIGRGEGIACYAVALVEAQ